MISQNWHFINSNQVVKHFDNPTIYFVQHTTNPIHVYITLITLIHLQQQQHHHQRYFLSIFSPFLQPWGRVEAGKRLRWSRCLMRATSKSPSPSVAPASSRKLASSAPFAVPRLPSSSSPPGRKSSPLVTLVSRLLLNASSLETLHRALVHFNWSKLIGMLMFVN